MKKSTTCLFILSVAIVIAALMSIGIGVSAQNANSSTTMMNSNAAKPKTQRRGRRGRAPKAAAETPAADTMATMPAAAPKMTGRCDPMQQEQTDLSGTYTGKLKHGNDPVADATLTITGNQFTGTMGGQTVSGRVVAVTTCGYTAVTMMHEGQPRAMSLRAKRMGNGLTLTSVPGEPEQIMFTTGGGAMRPRKHRRMTKKPDAAPAAPKTTP
jgi:hypothetical protein